MKYCILTWYLVFFSNPIFSQGSIGLSVGVDFAQFQSYGHNRGFDRFLEKGYVNSSLLFGIRGEHFLTKKIGIDVAMSFTTKRNVRRTDRGWSPDQLAVSQNVDVLSSAIKLNYTLLKNFMVGAGIHNNYFLNATDVQENGNNRFSNKNVSAFGLIIGLNYRIKRFIMEVNYLNGSDFKIDLTSPFYNFTKRVKSFNFKIGYMFQLYEG